MRGVHDRRFIGQNAAFCPNLEGESAGRRPQVAGVRARGVRVNVPGAPAPAEQPSEVPPERRRLPVTWLLTAAMAATAVAIILPVLLDDPGAATPDLTWLVLVPLFALTEVVVIHLPTQRNAHGHTLREIPAVLGLTFLAPQQYVSAYVVGAVLALVVAARMRGVKLA